MVCYDRTIFGRDTTIWKSGIWGCKKIKILRNYLLMIFVIKEKWIILTHTMCCWLLLQIYLCYLWLLLCSRDTYVTFTSNYWVNLFFKKLNPTPIFSVWMRVPPITEMSFVQTYISVFLHSGIYELYSYERMQTAARGCYEYGLTCLK